MNNLTFQEYQETAKEYTDKPELIDLQYAVISLCNEAGECAGVVKKQLWKPEQAYKAQRRLLDEMGDVLWSLMALADSSGLSLIEVAECSLQKLRLRALPEHRKQYESETGQLPMFRDSNNK
jgi:NTP pyrophosphatase (non-canonical NTP hydrolase)